MQTLIIKGELTDLNTYINAERSNKHWAATIKKDETQRVYWNIKEQHIDKVAYPIDELQINWFVRNNKKDADNITFAKKYILDALVLAKIIPTDGRQFINNFKDNVITDANYPRIEVTF